MAALWDSYAANPDAHPNLPNNSFAGYRRGEAPLPDVPVVTRLSDWGGKADGQTDNTAAFKAAIAEAAQKGGGAIELGAGDYRVGGLIHLNRSGVVLRGLGPNQTTISFDKSLSDIVGSLKYNPAGNQKWAWMGGLIWVSPEDTFNGQGKLANPLLFSDNAADGRTSSDLIESWRPVSATPASGKLTSIDAPPLATLNAPAKVGDWKVQVADGANLRAGEFVLMAWTPDLENYALWKELAGHPLMDVYNWGGSKGLNKTSKLRWPVQIASVEGNTVTLTQPLRLEVRPQWNVQFEATGPTVQESGIENLTIKVLGAPLKVDHLKNAGSNGLYFNRAINCWAKNVTIENAENGVFMAQDKNITLTGLKIRGEVFLHHAISARYQTADVLVEDFSVEAPVMHGLNTEAFASGNVWSRGKMEHGTFDSHRKMPYDAIRTEITMSNDGRPGGNNDEGPFNGKRVVHWNIDITGDQGIYVNQPDAHSMGALVGVRGAPLDTSEGWGMVKGDKNTLVVAPGAPVQPANLYQAQLGLRRASRPWVGIARLFDGDIVTPGAVTLGAVANAGAGRRVERVDFLAGTPGAAGMGSTVASAGGAGRERTGEWRAQPGRYLLRARLTDDAGQQTLSAPVEVTVGRLAVLQESDPALQWSGEWKEVAVEGALGGQVKRAAKAGAEMTYRFKGTQVALYTQGRGGFSNSNEIDLYLDDKLVLSANPYYRKEVPSELFWSSGALTDGPHTLRVVAKKDNVSIDAVRAITTQEK